MKFSIRDLFLVTVIVALALGWWLDRSKLEMAKGTYENDARLLSQYFNLESGAWSEEWLNETVLKYHPEYRTTAKPSKPFLQPRLAPIPNTPKPSPPKYGLLLWFSIRDIMLVTVIVALTVGWWVSHRRQAIKIGELTSKGYPESHGGAIQSLPTSQTPATLPKP